MVVTISDVHFSYSLWFMSLSATALHFVGFYLVKKPFEAVYTLFIYFSIDWFKYIY